MTKIIKYTLMLFIGIFAGILLSQIYYTRKIHKIEGNCEIRYREDIELNDTSCYTGKDVSQYMFSPLRLENGVIPDAKAAAKIAYDYVSILYGEECAKREQPYQIQLTNNQIWSITGRPLPENSNGGTFDITIEKYTGRIWTVIHEK